MTKRSIKRLFRASAAADNHINCHNKPSLTDYTNFHGMLCGIATAKRCIDSFDGVALFADQSTYDHGHGGDDENWPQTLAAYDYNRRKLPLLALNVVSYYLLVLFSFTGLCTLAGHTRVLQNEEYSAGLMESDAEGVEFKSGQNQLIPSRVADNLHIPPQVIDYICSRSMELSKEAVENDSSYSKASTSATPKSSLSNVVTVVLKRRFEFDFGGYLSVMMLHFVCSHRRTHLVEVYRFQNNSLVGRFASSLMYVSHLLNFWTLSGGGDVGVATEKEE